MILRTEIVIAACLVLGLACVDSAGESVDPVSMPTDTGFPGLYLVFAETVTTSSYRTSATDRTDRNIYLRIGHYRFLPGDRVRLRYFLFDGRDNKTPSPHATAIRPDRPDLPGGFCEEHAHPAGPEFAGLKVRRPVYSDFVDIEGTWEAAGDLVRMTFRNTTHEWVRDPGDSTLFRPNKPFFDRATGAHVIDGRTYSDNFGYGYLTGDYKMPAEDVGPDRLFDRYTGEYYHHNAHQTFVSGWEYQADRSFNPGLFQVVGDDMMAFWDRETFPVMVEYILLFGDAPHSNLIIYNDFGKDFDDNDCFDDYGHTQFMWGVMDGGMIRHVVFVEYSYQFDGKPMFTVGRYSAANV